MMRHGGSVESVDVLAATAFAEATVVKKSAKSAEMIAVLRWRCFNAEAQGRRVRRDVWPCRTCRGGECESGGSVAPRRSNEE